jgi:hypothetical protein
MALSGKYQDRNMLRSEETQLIKDVATLMERTKDLPSGITKNQRNTIAAGMGTSIAAVITAFLGAFLNR